MSNTEQPEPPAQETREGLWGTYRTQSLKELDAQKPRVRKRPKTERKPMSERMRMACMSEQRLATLAANRAKLRAEGRPPKTPVGTVQGWGGTRRKELIRLRAEAETKATIIMEALEKDGIVTPVDLSEALGPDGKVSDEAAAHIALKHQVSVLLAKETYPIAAQNAAAATILRFTKAPPATTTNVKVDAAHDWLQSVLAAEAEKPTE